jgi:aspartate kinase
MKVFKFGGASVKNAASIKNVGNIIQHYKGDKILVVVSAMGKTTNALEKIVELAYAGKDYTNELNSLKLYHLETIKELNDNTEEINERVTNYFDSINGLINRNEEYDKVYDSIVSIGEVTSSEILNSYLTSIGFESEWVDARKYIITDKDWREGKVDWDKTRCRIRSLQNILKDRLIVTQGFIGSTPEGHTTTLGREGSDYSAAIFASSLDAKSVTIWKDVPGVMSADPKRLKSAIVFEELPYQEAAEMTYYGASVIHPKTIKPLANARIPLLVKNFDDPTLPGTIIHECKVDKLPPLIVFKENQCLISCKVTDYTFVNEEQIGFIFHSLMHHGVQFNVMQNSAISFSFCVDFRDKKVMKLIDELSNVFEVYYNTGLTLVTIKNYDAKSYNEYKNLNGVLLEQSSRSTLQVLVKN